MPTKADSWSQERWTQEGRHAILSLLGERMVAPWAEVEARISNGWKEFRPVQPLQLGGARRELVAEGLVCEDRTSHGSPVVTLRLPFEKGKQRAVERLRGEKRTLYRTYLKWTGDPAACGHHAEGVVLESMKAAGAAGGLVIPRQRTGHVPAVRRVPVAPGPLDALAYLPDLPDALRPAVPLVVEVKNVHDWIRAA